MLSYRVQSPPRRLPFFLPLAHSFDSTNISMSEPISGISPESLNAKSPQARGEAPGTQCNVTGLVIQELLKSVKGFQASLEILSAKVEGNGLLPESNKLSTEEKFGPTDTLEEEPGGSPPTDTKVTETMDTWPSSEKIAQYKERCAKHRRECEKMQVELGCLISHLGIIGGVVKEIIENAQKVHNNLLSPVQSVERALGSTSDEGQNSMRNLIGSFSMISESVNDFSVHYRKPYDEEIAKWKSCIENGCRQILGLVNDGKFVRCLDYVHTEFFSDLEAAMGGLIEALMAYEEKAADEWLTAEKLEDFERKYKAYISRALQSTDSTGASGDWLAADAIMELERRSNEHRKVCNKMRGELNHLIAHYDRVGCIKESVDALKLIRDQLLVPLQKLFSIPFVTQAYTQLAMLDMFVSLKELHSSVERFLASLYRQKHAFYFRRVKQWAECLSNGMKKILVLLLRCQLEECLEYILYDLFSELESTMIGASIELKKPDLVEEKLSKIDAGNVIEEMKTFGKESLPKFLVDEMERDTTRYINLTTIATFFSSVTATTLQFTYAPLQSEASESLRGIVNLFWFLSLVFSVSSGVNSLLGLTWRKSSIYDSRVPPKLIRMWFDKAPMVFLIVAAVAFVIGLNMFAYLSLQPRYVSLAMTILTGIHGACLMTITAWFIYQLKHESIWAGWMRTVMKPITTIIGRTSTGVRWIWQMVKRPYEKYKVNLHLQRNIYWAFGIDNRVARLNSRIYWARGWSEPYLLSKLIRRIAYPIKRCWLTTKKALSDLSHTVRAHICAPSHTGDAGDDVERGESVRRKEAEAPKETASENPAEKAKNNFRGSLQKIFSDTNHVNKIMLKINLYENAIIDNDELLFKWQFKSYLWGYADLFDKMCEELRPALVKAREKKNEKGKEKEEEQNMSMGHADNAQIVPKAMGQDKHDTVPVPPQSSQIVPLDDEANGTQMDTRPDSQGQPENHPPTLDEHALFIDSGNTEAFECTPRDSIPQSERGARATTPNEIEEDLPALERKTEGS